MLLDYIEEYGAASFDNEPLNNLDLLAFSMLCNFDFPAECIGQSLPDALEHVEVPGVWSNRRQRMVAAHPDKNDLSLAEKASSAGRYRSIRVHDFVSAFEKGSRQFAGLALVVGDLLIVAFRGTDDTFTGWREALKLSLDRVLPSHLDAAAFLDRCAGSTEGPILVCGHSKGGSLALYAASLCEGRNASRIAQTVGFDAPGAPPSVRESPNYGIMSPLMVNYVPRSSVVGTVHRNSLEENLFIRSKGVLFNQHYPYRWLTRGTDFVYASQSKGGKILDSGLALVINRIGDSRKRKVIDGVFDLLDRTGKVSFTKEK